MDVSNSTIDCSSVAASMTIKPALSDTSPPATTFTLTLSGNLGGCTTDNPATHIASGSLSGTMTLTLANPNCDSLLVNPAPAIGTLQITWKTSDGTVLEQPATNFLGNSVTPQLATVTQGGSPILTALYPVFTVAGTNAPGSAFAGAPTPTLVGMTQVDFNTLKASCASGGLRQIVFGVAEFKVK